MIKYLRCFGVVVVKDCFDVVIWDVINVGDIFGFWYFVNVREIVKLEGDLVVGIIRFVDGFEGVYFIKLVIFFRLEKVVLFWMILIDWYLEMR